MKETTIFLAIVLTALLGWEIYAIYDSDIALITTAVRHWDDLSGGLVMGIFIVLVYHFFFRRK